MDKVLEQPPRSEISAGTDHLKIQRDPVGVPGTLRSHEMVQRNTRCLHDFHQLVFREHGPERRHTQTLNVWYTYLHLAIFYGKCR